MTIILTDGNNRKLQEHMRFTASHESQCWTKKTKPMDQLLLTWTVTGGLLSRKCRVQENMTSTVPRRKPCITLNNCCLPAKQHFNVVVVGYRDPTYIWQCWDILWSLKKKCTDDRNEKVSYFSLNSVKNSHSFSSVVFHSAHHILMLKTFCVTDCCAYPSWVTHTKTFS